MTTNDRTTPHPRSVVAALAIAVLVLGFGGPTAAFAQDDGSGLDPACQDAGIVDADECAQYLAGNDQPPPEEPVVDEAPPDEPAVEEPPVDEPVVDEPQVDEPVVDEPVVDEPVVDEPPVDEPVVDEPPVDEPVVDEPSVEEPVVDDVPSDEPVVDDAVSDEPIADDVPSDEPVVDEPSSEEPVVDAPSDEPAVDEPSSEEVVTDETPSDQPAIDQDASSDEPANDDGASSEDEGVTDESSEPEVTDESSAEPEVTDESSAEPDVSDESSAAPDVTDQPSDEPIADPAVEDDTTFTADDAPENAAFVDDTPVATDDQGQQVEPITDLPPDTDPADVAPVTDSAKVGDDATAPEAPEYVPTDDAEAQNFEAPPPTDPVADQDATQLDAPPAFEPPQGVTIIDQSTNIYEVNNQIVINNFADDRDRLAYDSSGVDYYSYPGGGWSETVYRDDGSQVITIYDRYGNIISRSVFDEAGNEYPLAYYDPAYEEDERMYWGDPGQDLPPLRIDVSLNLYIFYYDRYDLADLTRFLLLPPVEPIRHLYTIDEVKRSPRLRDAVPRVEIGELTFATGVSDVTKQQVPKLKKLASAILAVLKKNRAETFLIEGHTDAVGDDRSNLILSDARARSVAKVLTRYFHVPPENLVTQGYGERFLKVKTLAPSGANRRVVVRRITSLITPRR